LAGFFEQVKSGDFRTLTIQSSHEEDQIHPYASSENKVVSPLNSKVWRRWDI